MVKGEVILALIKCSECGKEISDRARSCPHCGCPVEGTEELVDKIVVEKEAPEEKTEETKSGEIKPKEKRNYPKKVLLQLLLRL